MKLKFLSSLLLAVALVVGAVATPAVAGPSDPLFVNLLTDEAHRANMALSFSKRQFDQGHPLTIFLNDRGVMLASKANAAKFADHQKMLSDLMSKGAVILICSMCMEHYGVNQAALIPGPKLATDLAGPALFKDNTKTLTW